MSDLIGLNGGQFSTYAYAGSSPLMYVDKDGLWPKGIPKPSDLTDGAKALGNLLTKPFTGSVESDTAYECVNNLSCSLYRSRGDEAVLEKCTDAVLNNKFIGPQDKGGAVGKCVSLCRERANSKCNKPVACLAPSGDKLGDVSSFLGEGN